METSNKVAHQDHAADSLETQRTPHPENSCLKNHATGICYTIGTATVLPLQNRIVMPDDTFVQIRPKSFDVLLYLCRHSGRLVEKETLVQAVWKDICVTDDSLVQCIVGIRKALGPQNSKHLRTITRRGYMVNAQTVDHTRGNQNFIAPTLVIGPFQCIDNSHDTQIAGGLCDGVIARLLNSKALPLHIKTSDEKPDANYQVNGNLQFQGERTRVTVQLLNLLSGQYIWANIYEKITKDPFLLQDNLSHDIANDLLSQIANQHSSVIETSG